MTASLAPADPTHLAQLYAISKLLLRSDDIEGAFPEVVALLGEAVPLRSAFLGVSGRDHARTVVLEEPTEPHEVREAARAHARDAYAFLTENRERLRDDEIVVCPLPPASTPRQGNGGRFLVLPLVVDGAPIFGVFQLETAARADEAALLLASTVANQLATALERRASVANDRVDSGRRAELDRADVQRADTRRDEAETLRERYVALVDGLDQAFVWECDARTFILDYVSAHAERFLGGSRERWLASDHSLIDLTVPDDRDALRETFVWASTLGTAQRVDHRCTAADGRLRWFHTNVHLTERVGGRSRLQGVSFDVTGAKEAELALRDQLDFVRAVTGSLGEGVVVADDEGRVISANGAACDLLAVTAHDLVGRVFRSVVGLRRTDGSEVPADECPLMRAAQTGLPQVEDDVDFIAGLTFSASYTCTPLRQRGHRAGAVMVFRSVSALKRAEQTQRLLAELGSTLGATLDHRTAIADLLQFATTSCCDAATLEVFAEDGTVDRVETAAREGCADTALLALGIDTERAHALSSREPAIVRVAAGSWIAVLPLIARDRAVGVLTMYALTGGRRTQVDDQNTLQEIARRASLALDNARLYEHAQRARRVRDDMLAVVSHDLRNPLGAILLQAEALLRDPTVSLTRPLESIKRSAGRMSRLIQDLLDVASIEAGRFSVERRSVDVAELVAEALEPLLGTAKAKGVELESVFERDLASVSVDPVRFDQVIGNLVGNAIKFTPAGGSVVLLVEAAEVGVRFSVLDTGPGIAPEDVPHVFDRFWQARATARLGTGLGLFISQGIVGAHGDAIEIDSKVGVGTVFSFVLPTAESHLPPLSAEQLAVLRATSRAHRIAELEDLSERTRRKSHA